MFMYLGGIPIPIEISVARGIQLLIREKRRRRRAEEEEEVVNNSIVQMIVLVWCGLVWFGGLADWQIDGE